MSAMKMEILAIVCPHCKGPLPLDPEKVHASAAALALYVEEKIDEHLGLCEDAKRVVRIAEERITTT